MASRSSYSTLRWWLRVIDYLPLLGACLVLFSASQVEWERGGPFWLSFGNGLLVAWAM